MSDRRAAWLLFGLLLSVFLVTSGGHFYSADGSKEYEVTRAIVTRRAIDVPRSQGLPGRNGKFYPPHGLGQSIAWVPFYAAGATLERAGFGDASHGLAASWLNAVATAAIGAMLFLLARGTRASRASSLALALIFGFSSMAWVYSKNTFDVVLTGALVTAGALLLVRAEEDGGRLSTLAWAGAALGWAGVTRVSTVVLWPLGVAFVWTLGRTGRVRRLVAFAVPAAASLAIILSYNYLRFGSIFDDGHKNDPATALSGNAFEGIGGFLVSPARGIVFFAPVVLVAVTGWNRLRRGAPRIAWFSLAAFVATMLTYAKVQGWQGGFSWGPRFLIPVLPLAVLPAVRVLDRWRDLSRLARAGVMLLVTGGGILTLPGVLADYQLQTLIQEEKGIRVTRVWEFDNAAYVYHAAVLDDIAADTARYPRAKSEAGRLERNTWDFWWWYAWIRRTGRPLVVPVMLALIASAAFFGVALKRGARREPG